MRAVRDADDAGGEGGMSGGLRQFLTAIDYQRAEVAYAHWALMTLLSSDRPMPDSTLRSWDRLRKDEQRFIWNLFEVKQWKDLSLSQRDAWAFAMREVFQDEERKASLLDSNLANT